jgi:uncharacterized protein
MIHKYKQCGLSIVIDVNSGAIHQVDDVVYDILDYYEDKTPEEIKKLLGSRYDEKQLQEGIDEVRQLADEGMLFTEDPYKDILKKENGETSYIKALCLNIAHDCNLRCKYCFASEGDYKGKRELMSFETGKRAIDFVIRNSGPRHNIEVDLFGGEPLMNFDVVKQIVDYANEEGPRHNKNIRFTITTNAMLLDKEKMDYIDKNMGNVVLSIDGRKEVNDSIRVRLDGTGSFDRILPSIKAMAERRQGKKQYYARGTFTRNNLDFYNDVLFLADEGFKEISVEPVVLEDGNPLALRQEDLPTIFEQYNKLTEEMIKREKQGKGFKFYHFAIDVNGGPCIYKRISGCGAGHEYVAVTPNGDIYPCHQFVGNKDFVMGNLYKDRSLDASISNTFKNGNVYSKPKCQDCWAKFYCSGGCQANNYNFNKDIHVPYEIGCQMMRKRVECAIAMKAKLSDEE